MDDAEFEDLFEDDVSPTNGDWAPLNAAPTPSKELEDHAFEDDQTECSYTPVSYVPQQSDAASAKPQSGHPTPDAPALTNPETPSSPFIAK